MPGLSRGQTALFTISDSVGCFPFTVDFTDQSSGADSLAWDFDDGLGSSLNNPTHIFYATGAFNVTLFAYDSIGSVDSFSTVINVTGGLPLMSVPNIACPHASVEFNVFGNYNPANTIIWDFGDGSSSTIRYADHAYLSPGNYTYIMAIQSPECGLVVDSGTILITDTLSPPVHIHPENISNMICPGELFPFYYDENLAITWDFGDGNTSSNPYPVHVYDSSGTFNVNITVTNECGNITSVDTSIVVSPNTPATAFAYGPASACKNDSVSFFTPPGSGEMWWNFDNGLLDSGQSVRHAFSDTGTFNVRLIVTNKCGLTDTDYVQVQVSDTLNPSEWMSIANPEACPNEGVLFLAPYGLNNYAWDFGDGNTSSIRNPTNTYVSSGIYIAVLTLSNGCGSTSYSDTVKISNNLISPAIFYIDQIEYCAGDLISFSGSSQNGITDHYWSFGDGNTDTSTNPYHLFQDTGTYTVSYVVTNFCGLTDTGIANIEINNMSYPISKFTFDTESACTNYTYGFTSLSSDSTKLSWHFGDGDSSNLVNPSHAYTAAGNYFVNLFVTNACGLKSVSSETIYVPSFSQLPAPFLSCVQEGDSMIFSWTSVQNASGYELSADAGSSWIFQSSVDSSYGVLGAIDSTYVMQIRALSNGVCQIGAVSDTASCTYVLIENIKEEREIELVVRPNPSSGKFHISLTNGHNLRYKISIRNIAGEIVVFDQLSGVEGSIDLANQSPGIYLMELTTESRRIIKRLVLIP
ncbi:MAG: PKD domain-containing protein [Flavobacteriales bacterium]|nr:PKD domain-containing protein [Flavobacteriales bacterium]